MDFEPLEKMFRVEVEPGDSQNRLILAGHIGSDAAGQLRDEAERLAGAGLGVVIDWREAETLTASSLQVLLALGVSLCGQGRTVGVSGDHPGIRGLLETAGLSARFPATVQSA